MTTFSGSSYVTKAPDVAPCALRRRKVVQCVLVGDVGVGKTSLIVSYTTNGYPREYVPTIYDKYSVDVQVDDELVTLELCDTAGRSECGSLRQLSYLHTDVFMLCFNVTCKSSLTKLRNIWISELVQKFSNKPTIVVGTKSDLRSDPRILIDLAKCQSSSPQRIVSRQEAARFAEEIGALCYMECSALTQHNLKNVFDAAILLAIHPSDDRCFSGQQDNNNNSFLLCHQHKLLQCRHHNKESHIVNERVDGKIKNVWKKFARVFS